GPAFETGNVRRTPFEVIWRTGQAMRRMREDSGDFRGGCRARALRLAGSVDAADPLADGPRRPRLCASVPERRAGQLAAGVAAAGVGNGTEAVPAVVRPTSGGRARTGRRPPCASPPARAPPARSRAPGPS